MIEFIEPHVSWDDLDLSGDTLDSIKSLVEHAIEQSRLMADWNDDRRKIADVGVSALFTGPAGTGKTMAAEAVASELDLPLCKLDLGTVQSKYIGETEKNLDALLREAATVDAVLLFDEADELFGNRTEVKDSQDRYANLDVNYLLQILEEYKGVAILTTNHRNDIEAALARRIRFIVDFPHLAPEER